MDLAQQLHAVEKAIGNAKKELIKDHIHHCMEETSEALPREFRDLIKEFQGVTKYLYRERHDAALRLLPCFLLAMMSAFSFSLSLVGRFH